MAGSTSVQTPLPRYFSAQVIRARRFSLRVPAKNRRGINVIGGGVEECRPDYVVDRPGFHFPILEFVATGAGKLVINRKTYVLMPGTVFTYGPGCHHRIISDPAHPLVKYFVVFSGQDSLSLMNSRELGLGTVLHVGEIDRIRRIFDDMIALGLGDRTDRESCCGMAAEYLAMMIRELRVPTGHSAARSFATYERCRQYMEKHALHLTSVGEVARNCHIDTSYLCRLFQRFGRERPHQYLQHMRMNRAMMLLQSTDRLIKDIAMELNFDDAANFTRAFRRWFGLPPQEARGGIR